MAEDKEEKAKGSIRGGVNKRRLSEKEKEKKAQETLEQTIIEFAKRSVLEQRNSFKDSFKLFDILNPQLELTWKLKHRINFLLSIKFEIFVPREKNNIDYGNANFRFDKFIVFLKENNINDKIEIVSDDEKTNVMQKIDNLSNAFNEYLKINTEMTQKIKESLRAIAILIEELRGSMEFVVGLVKGREREREETTAVDLEKQAGVFSGKGRDYRINSILFLAGVVAFIVLMAYLPMLYSKFLQPINVSHFFYQTNKDYLYFYLALKFIFSGKALLSVATIIGLLACIRFYAASNHNAIVCDQRANTLKSYKALRDASKTNEERLMVLEKILDSATDHQATGFSRQEKNTSGNVIGRITADLVRLLKK